MTKEKSRLCETKCSEAKASKRLMASRKVPAFRTCSQVRVVKLAIVDRKSASILTGVDMWVVEIRKVCVGRFVLFVTYCTKV